MAFSVVMLTVAFSVCVLYFVWKYGRIAINSYRRAKSLDKLAALPRRRWFNGHIGFFQGPPHERLMKASQLCSSYPTMLNAWRGPIFSILSMHHHDTAVSFLSSGAPKDDFIYRFLRPWLGDGLLTSKGKKWQRNRHLLTPAFHFSILKPYTLVFNECCRVMMEKWSAMEGVKPLEISTDVSLMTLDTILHCAMSCKTNCQHTQGKHPYIDAIKNVGTILMLRTLKPLYFFDFLFYLSPMGRSFKKSIAVLHEHTEEIIKQRKESLLKDNLETSEQGSRSEVSQDNLYNTKRKSMLDFLDILLQTKDEDGSGLSDREIRDEVDTFLFEGHDTTSSGISWALYNLAKYQQYQEKCRKEIYEVVGQKQNVEWEDLSQLQYLTMFIKESLRLYPPVFIIGRKFHKDIHIQSDYNIPKNNVVPKESTSVLNIFALHRNVHVWEDPEVFNPERFTKDNCAKRNTYSYVPFSAGSRNCIGQNFAMAEMKIVLAQILRSFELYIDEETPKPELDPRLILQSRDGIFIKLKSL